MARKIWLLTAAMAICALAAPALAQAGKITQKAGELAPKGTTVTLTSTSFELSETVAGTVKCASVTLAEQIIENGAFGLKLEPKGEGTTKTCTAGGKEVKVTDATLKTLESGVSGSGTASLTLTVDFSGLTCVFSESLMPVSYTVGTDKLSIESRMFSTPEACSATKLGALLRSEFTVEIGSTAVILD